MSTTTTYTATAVREGRWWTITVPDVDGVTQARRLADAPTMARELVAVTLAVPLDTVEVALAVARVDGLDVGAELDAIRAEREQAAALERDASQRAQRLARDLAAADVTLRDVGAILGVSHQRAHQLVSS
ncbi:hypothetical protein Cch01nite_24840 [Cellulomonas chitinilytica]|uniref:Antitoxin HicB n=1 Tax=Cellulomonas chitinilytica TaxID=398759 RepID=A0A919P2Z7_9CELL|nr:hypothetical protein [Cellulomonas chitinilytica]GIG21760.1 hypothetical protein Cch01nite_24840 [Cellulomonas chitinilytica]